MVFCRGKSASYGLKECGIPDFKIFQDTCYWFMWGHYFIWHVIVTFRWLA